MYENLSLPDQQQLFGNSLLFYNGNLVKVKSVHDDFMYRILDIKSQKTKMEKVDLLKFAPPMKRLGMVNAGGGVFYMKRIPMRQFHIGLTNENTKFEALDVNFPEGAGATKEKLSRFEAPEIAEALFNEYPTIRECIATNRITDGAMAFDKQFAIDARHQIWYKLQVVGKMPRGCSTVQKIVFDEGFTHLNLLLEKNYEKDLRTLAPTLG